MNQFTISVIIPTHNRCALLRRSLDALCAQTFPAHEFEVIVVADKCVDDTLSMLRQYTAPFTLRIVEHQKPGRASDSRNVGAAQAASDLLLFLDDDVEPLPPLVEAHVRAHQAQDGRVVMGPYLPYFERDSFARIQIHTWWDELFQAMLEPGHRYAYSELLSGNLSMSKAIFCAIGGFDPAFHVHEDSELGIRLIRADVPFVLIPEARALHHDYSDTDRSFERKRLEGVADVMLAQRYPELFESLPLSRYHESPLSMHSWRMLAFRWPAAGDLLASILRWLIDLLETMQLRHYWKIVHGALKEYWYWRGVAETVGSADAFASLVEAAILAQPQVDVLDIDLSQGWGVVERIIDERRPRALAVRFGKSPVGFMPRQPGAERLRGEHLRPLLLARFPVSLLEAMALESAIAPAHEVEPLKLFKSIRASADWFGVPEPGKSWFEQYSQWRLSEATDDPINWEDWRWLATERAQFLESQRTNTSSFQPFGWQRQIYRLLYRLHEPVYHWYSARGWGWTSTVREKLKGALLAVHK